MFISTETMSFLNTKELDALQSYLYSGFSSVTVIVVYRRYYDWLTSVHNQI
jgi:hypothetical protein